MGDAVLPQSRMPERTDPVATALVSRFRHQRPLRCGSLIITVFGDAIAPRGGAITLASLIDVMAPFSVTERLVRTSVGRLAADGWLTSHRFGRLSEYRLSASGRAHFADATRRIYAGPTTAWTGRWTLVLMHGIAAVQRQRIREALRWQGFGELGASVLAHPTLTPGEARGELARLGLADGLIILESQGADAGENRRLVTDGWDLRELVARYLRFVRGFAPVLPAVRGRQRPAPLSAFLVRTLLIHEYRKIHLRDPLLPPSLLPGDWPGTAAYELCATVYERVFPAAEAHLAATAARLAGPLPAADATVYGRFSGLPRTRFAGEAGQCGFASPVRRISR